MSGAAAAQRLLHIGFVAIPIIAGIDKFAMVLAEWDRYLAPIVPQTLGLTSEVVMRAVGVIEILAGLLVAFRPKVGAYVIVAWLAGIIVNLSLNPTNWSASPDARFWDVGLRDVGLLCAALCLAWLTPSDRTETAQSSQMKQ
jgi:hypothetical protein